MDMYLTKKEMLEPKKVKKKISKAQMHLAIIKKKQCDAKALTIVEQLLEPVINSQWLLSNLRHINRSHMEDVIEERAILKLCGYILCDKPLTTIIDQRYHISTKKNKVYDITRRKNFCSSCCYGACNYLLEQMLTSPLWLRDKEDIPEFKILSAKDELKKSTPGDEIIVSDVNTVLNCEGKDEQAESNTCKNSNNRSLNMFVEATTHNQCSIENPQLKSGNDTANIITEQASILEEHLSNSINEESEDMKNLSNDSGNKSDTTREFESENNDTNFCISEKHILLQPVEDTANMAKSLSLNEDYQHVENKRQFGLVDQLEIEDKINTEMVHSNNNRKDHIQKIEISKSKDYNKRNLIKEKQSSQFYNIAMHIEQSVTDWITEDTVCLLSGEGDVKNRFLNNIVQHDRYLHLCKRLNKLQLEDEKDVRTDLSSSTLKPLPHLTVLQEQGKNMELKVRAFYKGSMTVENSNIISENAKQDDDFTPVLPLTDAHAPKILRRRIFLNKLNRILPDLLRALASNKLPQYVYSSEKSALIKALVNTFSLSAANIVFKTAEWTLVGLIIIKMLSMIDPQLHLVLTTKQATMYISMILMSFKLDSSYLDRLVVELINSTKISKTKNVTNTDML